jgi:hypothetical protein
MNTRPDRDENGRFLNGNKRAVGRPRGSRSKLSETFISDLNEAWETHGVAALNKCATQEPVKFCKIVADLLPSKMEASLNVTNIFAQYNLTDPREFAAAWEIARKVVYGQAPIAEIDSDLRDAEFTE